MILTFARLIAVAIAGVAVIDPALRTARSGRPLVSLITGDAGQGLIDDTRASLERRFTVVRGSSDVSAATVLVGGMLPDENPARTPVFGVWQNAAAQDTRIRRVSVPRPVSVDAQVPVDVHVDVRGVQGRRLALDLLSDGIRRGMSDTLVPFDSGSMTLRATVMPTPGVELLEIRTRVNGPSMADTAFTVLDARPERYPILFFDARPSWNSTFVRRALERDPRFSVSHRVLTSRGLSNTAGRVPASLADAAALREFAVVVVGAPDLLGAEEIRGLESFMRRRGGRVILLMEDRSSAAIDRLIGASTWRVVRMVEPISIRDPQQEAVLRGREVLVPGTPPAGALISAVIVGQDSTRHAAVWSVPVGAGRVTVAGAGDAWQFRGLPTGFDVFWASAVAREAQQAPTPIEVEVSRQVLAPGEQSVAHVTIRDVFLSEGTRASAVASAALVSATDSTPVRLWPDLEPGTFRAQLVAPRAHGTYSLHVAWENHRSDIPIIVEPAAASRGTADRRVVESWISSRGGELLDEDDVNRLAARVASAIPPVSRVETWYPMRSGWWIVPFALLLGAEWFVRRRRGLA